MAFSVSETIKPVKYFRRSGETLYKEHPETDGSQVLLTATQDGITESTLQAELVAVHSKINAANAAIAGQTVTKVVADIAARSALTNLHVGDQCYVIDATSDATVSSGGAKYIVQALDNGVPTWTKTAEAESMDVVVQWADVQGKEVDVIHVATMPAAMPATLADGGLVVVDA